jgi:FMN reductase
MLDKPPYIVAVGGTLRPGSSTEKAMRHVLGAAERAGARVLVAQLALADGIILGSPGYHGSISGLVKNALDYAEDLRNDARPYFSGRAVGCIATAGGWPGAVNTLGALRDIVHSLRGWPTPMGAAINTSDKVFDEAGACTSPRVAQMLDLIAAEVLDFIKR